MFEETWAVDKVITQCEDVNIWSMGLALDLNCLNDNVQVMRREYGIVWHITWSEYWVVGCLIWAVYLAVLHVFWSECWVVQ